LFDPSVARVDLAAERIVRLTSDPGTVACITYRFRGPLPAVGHRHNFNLRVRKHIEQPCRNILRDCLRVQRAFEFIRSDKDFHVYHFIRYDRSSS
jgi:hypothetical protein